MDETEERLERLRKYAEQLLEAQESSKQVRTPEEIQSLIHELEVHQIELELQNEELRSSQVRLEETRHQYQILYDYAPMAYVTLDQQANFMAANHFSSEMLGMTREGLLKSRFYTFVKEEKRDDLYLFLKKIAKSDGTQFGEFQLLDAKGHSFVAQLSGKSLRDTDLVWITINDISHIKAAESESTAARIKAQQADHLKSAFLANMSHEIRTPLNSIIGYLDLSLQEELNPEIRENLTIARNSGELLTAIIQDILDLSKIEAGQMEIERNSFSLPTVFAHLEKTANMFLKQKWKEIHLEQHVSGDITGSIMGDIWRVQQVLNNLLSNALKFTESGRIDYGVKLSDENTLEFFVKDSGPGIPANMLETVFEPFRQVEFSHSRQFGGTGLGLTISKKLVNLMGGEVHLESHTGNGHGSEFSFTIPYEPALNLNPDAVNNTNPGAVNNKNPGQNLILVVEDDEDSRVLARKILEKAGFTVETAENGLQAVMKYQSELPIDLILMDIQMPVMDGLEATREIRRLEKLSPLEGRTPIIALSAAAMNTDQENGIIAGIDAYLTKPVKRDALFQALAKYLKADA